MILVLTNLLGCSSVQARIVLGFACVAVAAGAAGCGRHAQVVGHGPTKVVAAFYPLAYAAQEIGGAAVTVENLTPPGAEPHDVELSPREVADVIRADLVLYLGGGFQPAVERAVGRRHGPSLDLARAAAEERPGRTADPHVWLDPVRYARMARAVGAALGRPARAAAFAGRALALDRAYRRGLARCARRELLTSHAAFGYLAARYGLRQVALEGLAPEAEPGPRAVRRLVEAVRRARATTVLTETLASPRLARTVAREAGVRTAVLDPLEGLTVERQARGTTYFTVMRANLRVLRRALGCR